MDKNINFVFLYQEKLESYLAALVDSNHITRQNRNKILDFANIAISNAKNKKGD